MGADLRTLVPLLQHKDPEIVVASVWIASEIVDGESGREIFDVLAKLLRHPERDVRFWAVCCVTDTANAGDKSALQSLISLLADRDPGLWKYTLHSVTGIADSTFEALRDWSAAALLLKDAARTEVVTLAKSSDTLLRRLAIAGLMRNFAEDESTVNEVLAVVGEDERREIEVQLELCRKLRERQQRRERNRPRKE